MVLPRRTPLSPAEIVRGVDSAWAERQARDAERYERRERAATWRRAGLCLVLAVLVVAGGIAGFRYETDTRMAPVQDVKSPGYVTVKVVRLGAVQGSAR